MAERTQELLDSNVALQTEINEHLSSQQSLLQSETRFRRLYDEAPSLFITVDTYQVILSVNHFGANLLGYKPENLVGNDLHSIIAEDDIELQNEFIAQCFHNQGLSEIELRLKGQQGSETWVRQTSRLIEDVDNRHCVLLACQDISETRALSDMLRFQASHDHLTGLFNRRSLEQHLQLLLLNSQEDHTSHTVLYLDVDQLKVVNDTCGHQAGDGLLRQLVSVIQGAIRKKDYMARIGGDEFAVILEYCPLQEAKFIAENIRHAVEEFTYIWETRSFKQSISIGVTDTSPDNVKIEEVMGAADAACYEAKQSGRNRVVLQPFSHNGLSPSHREMHWVSHLQKALINNQFELFFQPISTPKHSEHFYIHYEVLLRYRDNEGKRILPSVFLPAAERFNMSDQIDLWVIEKTFHYLEHHPEHTEQLDFCSINLSGLSFSSHRIEAALERLVVHSRVPFHKICFEITETAAISNLNEAKEFMEKLKVHGFKFALDDFGSGMASFGYLKNLPVDFIKIDGIFVKDMVTDRVDRAMVESINNIGHELDLITIAEFANSEAILDTLNSINLDLAQGGAISMPMPLTELQAYYHSELSIQKLKLDDK